MPNKIIWSWNPFRVWAELKKPDPSLRETLNWKLGQNRLDQAQELQEHHFKLIDLKAEEHRLVQKLNFLESGHGQS